MTSATTTLGRTLLGLAICAASASWASAASFTIIDGEGFEAGAANPPSYSTTFLGTGQLEGQFASTNEGFGSEQWVRSPVGGTSSAVVQDSVAASGSQAVRVDRAANSDDRWAVEVSGFPSTDNPLVCIEWDMLVEEATSTPNGSFGPFFGVESYDNEVSLLRLGTLGVDAATGDVLGINRASGFFETGVTVNFGEWNSFRIVLDFRTDTYYGFLNNVRLFDTDFEFIGGEQFSEADIAAIAAGGDPDSQAATGTAYFDNYLVFETDDFSKIPEPAALLLISLACGMGLARRNRGALQS